MNSFRDQLALLFLSKQESFTNIQPVIQETTMLAYDYADSVIKARDDMDKKNGLDSLIKEDINSTLVLCCSNPIVVTTEYQDIYCNGFIKNCTMTYCDNCKKTISVYHT